MPAEPAEKSTGFYQRNIKIYFQNARKYVRPEKYFPPA
jgi:hypothetical protein